MPVGDLTEDDEPLMAVSCGDETSIENVSPLDGRGKGRPPELAAPADRGESPVEEGDIFLFFFLLSSSLPSSTLKRPNLGDDKPTKASLPFPGYLSYRSYQS
jgi:hypothetical protein